MNNKKKLAIIQSSYIPWKGYFDIINEVDIFVFLEDVQFTKQDWRNRNKIKMKDGAKWATVPVKESKHHLRQKIYEVKINNTINWQRKHYESLKVNYSKAKYFKDYREMTEDLYFRKNWDFLSEMNIYMTKILCEALGINTLFYNSKDYDFSGKRTDKLVNICKYFSADYYLSGPSAKDYIDDDKFKEAGIALAYKDYSQYPEYPQLYPPFDHHVTVFDLIFNCGPEAPFYIWGWRKQR